MGRSTDLFCNISFNKKSYNSLSEVESDIDDIRRKISSCKYNLRTLAFMTEPNKFYDRENYDSAIDWIRDEFENNILLLDELQYDLLKLEYLRDNWKNCHNDEGLAISFPESIDWVLLI